MDREKSGKQQAKAWRIGKGKRSSARIGRKRKSVVPEGVTSRVTSPSEWVSSQSVPNKWIVVQHDNDEELKLCQIVCQNIPDVSPLVVSRSLIVAAMNVKGRSGMRWHPVFLHWCLNLSRVSPKAYEIMKQSGIELPTRRTLNNYTQRISAKPVFSHEVDMFLRSEAKIDELEEWQRFVVLILDEIKIREDLVFDKSGHRLHGFVNLGDINRELKALDDQASESSSPSSNIATRTYPNGPWNLYKIRISLCNTNYAQ
uniref:Transposable element P transposase-like RNase H domain-containing protein n=1 Tax=Amphimedon queenslandica TaxID=400682 RepID=A0A1X7TDQ0_AMPQE